MSDSSVLERISGNLLRRPPSAFFARRTPCAAVSKPYLIATAGRNGSTFLCARIAEYGRLGFPREFLNESFLAEFDRIFPNPNLQDYETYVLSAFASDAGVFGVKSDWWRFQEASRLGLLRQVLGDLELIVFLRRRDIAAQAVSAALAVETAVWHTADVQQEDLDPWHAGVAYDREKIERQARAILDQEYYWTRFIARSGAPVLELDYETVCADADAGVRAIAKALDVDVEPPTASADVIRKARSTTAAAWRERFTAESQGFLRFWDTNRGLMTATPPN